MYGLPVITVESPVQEELQCQLVPVLQNDFLLHYLRIFRWQRHGADGDLFMEMDGGFRALQLKKTDVSDLVKGLQSQTLCNKP